MFVLQFFFHLKRTKNKQNKINAMSQHQLIRSFSCAKIHNFPPIFSSFIEFFQGATMTLMAERIVETMMARRRNETSTHPLGSSLLPLSCASIFTLGTIFICLVWEKFTLLFFLFICLFFILNLFCFCLF